MGGMTGRTHRSWNKAAPVMLRSVVCDEASLGWTMHGLDMRTRHGLVVAVPEILRFAQNDMSSICS